MFDYKFIHVKPSPKRGRKKRRNDGINEIKTPIPKLVSREGRTFPKSRYWQGQPTENFSRKTHCPTTLDPHVLTREAIVSWIKGRISVWAVGARWGRRFVRLGIFYSEQDAFSKKVCLSAQSSQSRWLSLPTRKWMGANPDWSIQV